MICLYANQYINKLSFCRVVHLYSQLNEHINRSMFMILYMYIYICICKEINAITIYLVVHTATFNIHLACI